MKYIPADKLKAEIERLKERAQAERVLHPKTILAVKNFLLIQDYDSLLSIIASLQQEQPEVDLEKEIDKYLMTIKAWQIQEAPFTSMENIARHFYELGKARKEGSALTKEDVRRIYFLVLDLQTKYTSIDGCLQEVADIFNKEKETQIDL